MSDTMHVYPVQDLVEHDTESDQCVCGPTLEAVKREDGSVGWIITHHSLDGREKKLAEEYMPAHAFSPSALFPTLCRTCLRVHTDTEQGGEER